LINSIKNNGRTLEFDEWRTVIRALKREGTADERK
jgi:hypothetical protein